LFPSDVLVKPNPNNKTIETAKVTFFFIAILWLFLEDPLHHSERLDSRVFACLYVYLPTAINPRYRDSQDDAAAGCAP
jgi:hypothetical protein